MLCSHWVEVNCEGHGPVSATKRGVGESKHWHLPLRTARGQSAARAEANRLFVKMETFDSVTFINAKAHAKCRNLQEWIIYITSSRCIPHRKTNNSGTVGRLSRARLQGHHWKSSTEPSSSVHSLCHNQKKKKILIFCLKWYVKSNIPLVLGKHAILSHQNKLCNFYSFSIICQGNKLWLFCSTLEAIRSLLLKASQLFWILVCLPVKAATFLT